MVFQRELAPETGRAHLQGYVHFKSPLSFERVREFLRHPQRGLICHIGYARASAGKNRTYCTKQDSRDPAPGSGPYEFGNCPLDSGCKRDWNEACELVRAGVALPQIARAYPSVIARNYKGLQALQFCLTQDRTDFPVVIWYFGPTGSGKTRRASQKALEVSGFPNSEFHRLGECAYFKDSSTKWWDGYANQHVCVIDDFRPDVIAFRDVLRLCDRYPLNVEIKGGMCKQNSKFVIFTSNKPPDELFRDHWNSHRLPHEDLMQLYRRIAEPDANGVRRGGIYHVGYDHEHSADANTMLMAHQLADYCRQHNTQAQQVNQGAVVEHFNPHT